jgi:hypothetical protein
MTQLASYTRGSDGNTFIPLGFNLLSAQTSKNRLHPMNDEIDKRSIGYKRRLSSLNKETDAMIDLLKTSCRKRRARKARNWLALIHQTQNLSWDKDCTL